MNETSKRKDDHIRIALHEDVAFEQLTTHFEHYRFTHQALPELDLEQVDTRTTFLGKSLTFPLLIASMTGGSATGTQLNRRLAEAAQAAGVGLALGSLRAALEDPATAASFQLRRYAPDILLLANLGAVQLNYGYGLDACRRAVELTEADALILHLNPLQEALQPEGQTRFAGLLPKIAALCRALPVPVIAKEVGWGLSLAVGHQLVEAGVAALDVAGAGGTSWSQVELHRSPTAQQREIAAAFREWGIPTAEALRALRIALPATPLIASGGLVTGVELAKALALGAELTSLARPLLHAASDSVEALLQQLEILRRQLQITMFAAGAGDIAALRQTPLVYDGPGQPKE